MTTLMQITTPGGLRRRCHAECYNARGNACTCICRGENHGVGLDRAVKQTALRHAHWLATAQAELNEQTPLRAVVAQICLNAQQHYFHAMLDVVDPDHQPIRYGPRRS